MTVLSEFTKSARDLSKNPLGIIALFIVLIYAMASIVLVQGNKLSVHERDIFVWFLVSYPVLVLLIFAWLVSRHSAKLYAPRDFQDQAHWMALQPGKTTSVAPPGEFRSNGAIDPDGSSVIGATRAQQSKSGVKSKSKGRRS